MSGVNDCIAIDWGTSNRRAFLLDGGGRVAGAWRDGAGVLAMRPDAYPTEIDRLRARFARRDVVAAGMVGSTRGWIDAPYVPAPAGLADLAAATRQVAPQVWIVPGVSLARDGRHDVMRGEEVQVLGAIAAGLAPTDAAFCQPGTHNKWIRTAGGRIVDVATTMTGELFALVRSGGILAGMLDGEAADGAAFRDGLERGGRGDLATALFEVRAKVLLGALAAADAASFASGVLIGADVASRRDLSGTEVRLLGTGALADLYAVAIARAGGTVLTIDAEAAFAAGIHALRELID